MIAFMSLAGVTQPEPLDYLAYTEEDATMEQRPVMPSSQPENPPRPHFSKGGMRGHFQKKHPHDISKSHVSCLTPWFSCCTLTDRAGRHRIHFTQKTAVGHLRSDRLPRGLRRSGRTDSHPTGDGHGTPFVLRLSKHERASCHVTAVFRFTDHKPI